MGTKRTPSPAEILSRLNGQIIIASGFGPAMGQVTLVTANGLTFTFDHGELAIELKLKEIKPK